MPRIHYFVPCTIEGCPGAMLARGLCRTHYMRLQRTGTTDPPQLPTHAERFWQFVNRDGPTHPVHGQCWVWTGAMFRREYGAFTVERKLLKAHRFSWEIHFGPIPDGLLVCHHCDNPSCVNPSHLFTGTTADNNDDCLRKGRRVKGERQHFAKLTSEQVREIRRRYVLDSAESGSTALAREFGVAHPTILKIVNRVTWKHL